MNSQERVRRAIEFSGPDRIPIFEDDILMIGTVPPNSWQPPERYYPFVSPDMVAAGLWRSERELPKDWCMTRHLAIDEWGCIWDVDHSRTELGILRKGPLEDGWELLDDYVPPDPRLPERYRTLDELGPSSAPDKYHLGGLGFFIGERSRYLRGWLDAFMDLALYPEQVDRLLNMLAHFQIGVVEMWGSHGADGVIAADDWGTQRDTFISPEMWQRFFKPVYSRVIERVHELGMHFILHSCGNIRKLISHFIEVSVDALHLDSPNFCGVEWLGKHAGGKIAFIPVVDIQTVLPHMDKDEIQAYAKKLIHHLGRYNGGIIGMGSYDVKEVGATEEANKWALEVGHLPQKLHQ